MMQGKDIVIKDEKGGVATVTISNVFQSNGVIHVGPPPFSLGIFFP